MGESEPFTLSDGCTATQSTASLSVSPGGQWQTADELIGLERFKADVLQSIKSLCVGPLVVPLIIEENRYYPTSRSN
jgi:hypothetical protein